MATLNDHVHISRSNSKLGPDIPSVNLPVGLTCRQDAPCYKLCYARKGRFSFRHNKDLLLKNLEIWQSSPDRFEREVVAAAAPVKFFRFHSSGDIPDEHYLRMMVRVADKCPDTHFLCFSKKFELVNAYMDQHELPDNLKIVLSAWQNFIPCNPHGLPCAYIELKNGDNSQIPQDAIPCRKYCGDCVMTGKSCWHLKRGQSVYFKQH